MRMSYRVSSMIVVVTYLLLALMEQVVGSSQPASPTRASESGVETFNPCMMWEQIPVTVRVATIVWFPSFLVLLVQGFRNRAVPRWVAAACLITIIPVINHQLWRVQQCYTKLAAVDFWICVGTVYLMCLHQLFQRPRRVAAQPKP
jgi:hypothetical protein